MCPKRRNAKKATAGYRETKARQCQKIAWYFVFIDPDDEEFKEIMNNARRKLEIPMPAGMPCKLQREKYRETCRVDECTTKIRLHCWKRMEGSPHKKHEDHIAGKWMNSLSHYNLVHKFYSYASSYENSCSKSSGGQGMEKMEKISAWNLTKVRSKKEVIDEARMSLQFILPH